ncbi:MAG: hypothetical protein IPM42_04220 [Saprospiraceae bacterium]|nr:hypothetical protein [Saprospiraceae bacterium]
MKQIILFFSFVLLAGVTANAQACSKSASASKSCCMSKKTASATQTEGTTMATFAAADAALVNNENVTKRTCEISGATSYYQKSVCATSGTVSWEEVEFDTNTKQFTKVASASMEKDPATGEKVKTEGKACCKGKSAKACAGKTEGKACAKKEGAE